MSERPELDMEIRLLEASGEFLRGSRYQAGVNLGRFPVPFYGMVYWRPSFVADPPDLSQKNDYSERLKYLLEEGAVRRNDAAAEVLGQSCRFTLAEFTTADIKRGKLKIRDEAESLYRLYVNMEKVGSPGFYIPYENFTYSSIYGMLQHARNAVVSESLQSGNEVFDHRMVPEEEIEVPEQFTRAIGYLAYRHA